MTNLIQTLNQVNWDFSDYSSQRFPLDVNSMSWYPATFPPPIPKFLIALLTAPKNIVFDPFGGSGTTVIEAIKQNRPFLYNDLNPFVVDEVRNIVRVLRESSLRPYLLQTLKKQDEEYLSANVVKGFCKEEIYKGKSAEVIREKYPQKMLEKMKSLGVSEELILWYHIDTLNELLQLYELASSDQDIGMLSARKYAFVSILKEVCSQRGHFTYITDNCRPANLRYYNAFSAYLSILNRLTISVDDFLRQFVVSNGEANLVRLIDQSTICCGDARKMSWVDNQSVDLILTSPPYLCAQDYIKTMRLNNLFFPNEGFDKLPGQEIGSRASRKRKNGPEVVNKFYDDMRAFCGEAERVLKKNKFFCLIIGQGKAKAIEGHDTIGELSTMIIQDFGFQKIYETSRTIGYKWNRLGGVDHEKIIIFQKK